MFSGSPRQRVTRNEIIGQVRVVDCHLEEDKRLDVNADFFAALSMQGVHRSLTGFDVTSDEVPAIGVHQPFGVAVHEQHAPVPDEHRARDGDGHAASVPD